MVLLSIIDMSVEGVFRKNGNIRRLKELSEAIDKDPSSVNLSEDNPVQVAALLKKFLRDLPDPLLTFKLHRLFVVSQSKWGLGAVGGTPAYVSLHSNVNHLYLDSWLNDACRTIQL